MDINNEYSDIFAHTRAMISEDLKFDLRFIQHCKNIGNPLLLDYLVKVACDVTAYNEIYPRSEFISIQFFSNPGLLDNASGA